MEEKLKSNKMIKIENIEEEIKELEEKYKEIVKQPEQETQESLGQPYQGRSVQTVVTYGAYEEPI